MYLTGFNNYPTRADAGRAFYTISSPAVLHDKTISFVQAEPIQHGQCPMEMGEFDVLNAAAMAMNGED